tara:strand:- start:273 stop:1568 length:1296 start_codon:yes stop_codon:yes gene_type:complete
MKYVIKSIAVIGSGTMGAGIAAIAAEKNLQVVLLDTDSEIAIKAKKKILDPKYRMLSNIEKGNNIYVGNIRDDLIKIKDCDWICEAVVEKLDIKKQIFSSIEKFRNKNSIVSSNTSGIPLRAITEDLSEDFKKNICITHFFNPVSIMKLCELIPGTTTEEGIIETLSNFLREEFDKGVVFGKDTVNFIGNRIGCYFMLRGLHEGKKARMNGIKIDEIDAILSKPFGLPPTGLYGLIDLIGLDIMYSVGNNLKDNLPAGDLGKDFVTLPEKELSLYNKGQLGRKTGGGFYRINKDTSGEKIKEVFDLELEEWKKIQKFNYDKDRNIFNKNTKISDFAWEVIGSTLLYAADLVPEISNDILNVDRAMKWGFAWEKGPFEMLDDFDPYNILDICENKNIHIPTMLKVLETSGEKKFYNENNEFLNINGEYEPIY